MCKVFHHDIGRASSDLVKRITRQLHQFMGRAKSTVHKDVTERLMQINSALAKEARKVLDVNKQERHIRGGMATKEKYRHLQE